MSLDPNAKVELRNPFHRVEGDKTYAQYHLEGLTDEVLRDMARNESAERAWRKAAVKFLIERGSRYASHPEFSFLADEIRKEQAAEQEVEAVVSSATESPVLEDKVVEKIVETWPTIEELFSNQEFIEKLKNSGYVINHAAVAEFRKSVIDKVMPDETVSGT